MTIQKTARMVRNISSVRITSFVNKLPNCFKCYILREENIFLTLSVLPCDIQAHKSCNFYKFPLPEAFSAFLFIPFHLNIKFYICILRLLKDWKEVAYLGQITTSNCYLRDASKNNNTLSRLRNCRRCT